MNLCFFLFIAIAVINQCESVDDARLKSVSSRFRKLVPPPRKQTQNETFPPIVSNHDSILGQSNNQPVSNYGSPQRFPDYKSFPPKFDPISGCSTYKFDDGSFIECPSNGQMSTISTIVTSLNQLNPRSLVKSYTVRHLHPSIKSFPGHLFANVTTLENLHISDTNVDTVSPEAFAGLDTSLKSLNLTNSRLARIPIKSISNLRSLENVDLEANLIEEIEPNSFAGLKLVTLSLQSNNISLLSGSSFAGLEETLQDLFLTGNNLTEFPLSSIQSLKRLKSLKLNDNSIGSLPSSSTNVKLSTLVHLDLGSNNISTISSKFFLTCPNLVTLSLSSNKLSVIEAGTFNHITRLETLNLSRNSLTKLPSNIFARTAQLVTLDLSFNLFKEVDSYFLKPLRFLRVINLGNNRIETIARKAFGSNSRLRRINLERNQLSSLYKDMFSSFSLLETLDLSHNNISKIDSGSFQKLSSLNISLSHNLLTRIPRFTFIEVSNVEILDLSYNNLSSISDEAFDSSDCTTILLNHNSFKNASLIPLGNLTSIKFVNVSHNEIQVIDRKSFTKVKLYEMAHIDLSYNSIQSMSGNKFELFWALRSLDLSHNNLTKLSSGSFGSSLPTLLELNLDDNQLKEVTSGSINGLISVKNITMRNNRLKRVPTIPVAVNYVDLSHNSITSVTCSSFPMMNALLAINLSFNNISRLESDSFCNLLTLRSIDLSFNQLSNVIDDVTPSILKLSSLQSLDLSHNLINSLNTSDTFGILPSLFKVNLSCNSISDIAPYAFNGLLQLQSLQLSHNRLESLSLDSFKGLVSLSSLDLSYNSFSRLGNRTHSILEDLLSLESLNLRGNRISFITRKSFPSSPWITYKLRDLDLSYNLLESLTVHDGLTTVQALNLSHNHIRKLLPGVYGNLTSLKSLDLSFNRIVNVDVGSFSYVSNHTRESGLGTRSNQSPDLPPPLESLDLAHNRIIMVEPKELLSLKSLKTLNLTGNPLSDLPCINQIVLRMARKGLDVKFSMSREVNNSDVNYCNNWLALNFRVQAFTPLKLVRNPSATQSSATALLPLSHSITFLFAMIVYKFTN